MNDILFYSMKDGYGFFSNFAPFPITVAGKVWPACGQEAVDLILHNFDRDPPARGQRGHADHRAVQVAEVACP